MGKSDITQFASGHVTSENDRILFENEELRRSLIVHFANDSDSEAVLSCLGWTNHLDGDR